MSQRERWASAFCFVVMTAVATIPGCGKAAPPGPSPTTISVGGSYDVVVTLRDNSCGNVAVAAMPTHVDHAPGATSFRLTHGALSYNGTLSLDGRFTTAPVSVTDAQGVTSTIHVDGRFTAAGLEADATVAQQPPTPACGYVVHWSGTKQGAANVIP